MLILLPSHIEGEAADAVTVGSGFTVTETVCVDEHVPVVPVIVYVCVDEGLAETLAPVVWFNPVAGLHV